MVIDVRMKKLGEGTIVVTLSLRELDTLLDALEYVLRNWEEFSKQSRSVRMYGVSARDVAELMDKLWQSYTKAQHVTI